MNSTDMWFENKIFMDRDRRYWDLQVCIAKSIAEMIKIFGKIIKVKRNPSSLSSNGLSGGPNFKQELCGIYKLMCPGWAECGVKHRNIDWVNRTGMVEVSQTKSTNFLSITHRKLGYPLWEGLEWKVEWLTLDGVTSRSMVDALLELCPHA